ncbi:MAG: uncharacterized protein KVP18_004857 [Porospora cf. gigantea A]|uniref:uncharacterized protein n=1 Tax=Porospora cf. gigantea A TaxID=2853593 RepID=UPI00355A2724|nr:MAG: hypothetical protein KVP18_004857 [Porospora cf. gigantea A]
MEGHHENDDLRFYEQKYPQVDEVVQVKVNAIQDVGAYGTLLEYNNLEGMILKSELSKRRFRSVNKLIKVGRVECVMVVRVDAEKGYIDLSKKRVSLEDIALCEDRYSKSKKVQQTIRHVAATFDIPVERLNELIVWPLQHRYHHVLDAFKEAAINPQEVFSHVQPGILPNGVIDAVINDIKMRLSPSILKIRARCEVSCSGYEGVEAVKAALIQGRSSSRIELPEPEKDEKDDSEEKVGKQKLKGEEREVSVRLVSPPEYAVVVSTFDKEGGIARVKRTLEVIEQKIMEFEGGGFSPLGEIIAVGGEEAAEEPREVSSSESDSGSEESEVEGMGLVEDDADAI